MTKILLVEDDKTIVEALSSALTFHDFSVEATDNSEKGYEKFVSEKPDLLILDINLPGADGFELCRKIRKVDQIVPIILLTARVQESDKLLGFELGADDYITKPFSAKELIARIRAVLKRSAGDKRGQTPNKIGLVEILLDQFLVKKGGKESSLSPKEQQILKLFLENPGKVISRDEIIDKIWGDDYFPSPKTIDNFIVKLRNKIEDNPKDPQHIITLHGAGYKLLL
ncbi:MAG: response regulator transcription factor [Candidatus Aminicenantes bacterium]|nr:response regulator transcription factor [Candidatus Aminicenantes bacterium]